MGELIDLAAARDRRRTRPRPTTARVLLECPDAVLVLTRRDGGPWGRVAHDAEFGPRDDGFAITPCGNGGWSTPAPLDTPVCLRCFPWTRT